MLHCCCCCGCGCGCGHSDCSISSNGKLRNMFARGDISTDDNGINKYFFATHKYDVRELPPCCSLSASLCAAAAAAAAVAATATHLLLLYIYKRRRKKKEDHFHSLRRWRCRLSPSIHTVRVALCVCIAHWTAFTFYIGITNTHRQHTGSTFNQFLHADVVREVLPYTHTHTHTRAHTIRLFASISSGFGNDRFQYVCLLCAHVIPFNGSEQQKQTKRRQKKKNNIELNWNWSAHIIMCRRHRWSRGGPSVWNGGSINARIKKPLIILFLFYRFV